MLCFIVDSLSLIVLRQNPSTLFHAVGIDKYHVKNEIQKLNLLKVTKRVNFYWGISWNTYAVANTETFSTFIWSVHMATWLMTSEHKVASWILLEAVLNWNGNLLHISLHNHLFIILVLLKYYWNGCKTAKSSVHKLFICRRPYIWYLPHLQGAPVPDLSCKILSNVKYTCTTFTPKL